MRGGRKCRCVHGLPWFAVCGECEAARWQADGHPRRLSWDGALLLTPERLIIADLNQRLAVYRAISRDWFAACALSVPPGPPVSVRVLES